MPDHVIFLFCFAFLGLLVIFCTLAYGNGERAGRSKLYMANKVLRVGQAYQLIHKEDLGSNWCSCLAVKIDGEGVVVGFVLNDTLVPERFTVDRNGTLLDVSGDYRSSKALSD